MIPLPQETIIAKRDGRALENDEIGRFVEGLVSGAVSEAQGAALAMAVFFNGLDRREAVALTLAMRDTGTVLDWRDLEGPVLDKHSTGGVGDTVSLLLAPILAACGAFVPMISGRGLGHTGGTLDKFDAIPGYDTAPDLARFRAAVRGAGCAIIGQTADLAPADRKLYAIRDVTGTVESIPLITASILSKKLAAGLGALVLDVKTGTGAFMPTTERAKALAESLVVVANGAGLRTGALVTDMNEPLASAAGNAVEMRNAVRLLAGEARDARLEAVTLALCAEALSLAGIEDGLARAQTALSSGAALEKFARMVALLGGPTDFIERLDTHLRAAPVIRDVFADGAGTIAAIDTRAVGMGVVALGGGRTRPDQAIDHSVGFDRLAGLGSDAGPGAPIGRVHARSEEDAAEGALRLRAAYRLGAAPARTGPIVSRVGPDLKEG